MATIHVRTGGSNFFIDEDRRRYLRVALDEDMTGRRDPSTGEVRWDWVHGADSPLLRDATWHDFCGTWEVDEANGRLYIWVDQPEVGPNEHGVVVRKGRHVSAPAAQVLGALEGP